MSAAKLVSSTALVVFCPNTVENRLSRLEAKLPLMGAVSALSVWKRFRARFASVRSSVRQQRVNATKSGARFGRGEFLLRIPYTT